MLTPTGVTLTGLTTTFRWLPIIPLMASFRLAAGGPLGVDRELPRTEAPAPQGDRRRLEPSRP